MAIVHNAPEELEPWLAHKPEALRRRLAKFKQFCHLMSDLPGEAGHYELQAFARAIGQKDDWIQHTGTPLEHYDLFDGAIVRAARAGARQVDRTEMARILTNRRLAMQAPKKDREPNCTVETNADGGTVFLCRRRTTAQARPSTSDDSSRQTPAAPTGKPPLRALTLWAPWAWAICYLGKPVENRDWKNGVPDWIVGQPLAIHAGALRTSTSTAWADMLEVVLGLSVEERIRLSEQVERCSTDSMDKFCSRIVAVAIVDRADPPLTGEPRMIGWRVSSQWGIYLRDVVVLPEPVPVDRGQLGLWIVPPGITDQVREQYRAGRQLQQKPIEPPASQAVTDVRQEQLSMFGLKERIEWD